ncbi:decaprenyl-phosphate phosphoribosyltransferase [Geobacter benzoatilyticus]|nr:decaprenyl-phosphate phosphoribosyltransferase [Geobacter benzoatilyticus]
MTIQEVRQGWPAIEMVRLLRPQQWLKNLLLLFPALLGGQILVKGLISQSLVPILAFCLSSSATYVINDIMDEERDKNHPKKHLRPLPSGSISRVVAGVFAFFLVTTGLLLGGWCGQKFFLFLLSYLVVSTLYSIRFKNYPVIDIFCISTGFVLRLIAGGIATGVAVSHWLFLNVFLLSVFLSTGKRLSESHALGGRAKEHRMSLAHYPKGFLEGILYMCGAAVLVTYTVYTLQKPNLVYTVPLCTFGIIQFALLANSGKSADPTEALLKNPAILLISLTWLVMVLWTLYG